MTKAEVRAYHRKQARKRRDSRSLDYAERLRVLRTFERRTSVTTYDLIKALGLRYSKHAPTPRGCWVGNHVLILQNPDEFQKWLISNNVDAETLEMWDACCVARAMAVNAVEGVIHDR
jgi:hypothetical protein